MKKLMLKSSILITASVLPIATLASCSIQYYDYFAEIVVSDNTSVLADNSFSQTTYEGYKQFMAEKTVTIPKPSNNNGGTGNGGKTSSGSSGNGTDNSNGTETYEKEVYTLPDADKVAQSTGLWRRPGATVAERVSTFKGSFVSGKDVMIVPGFNHEKSLKQIALDKDFSDKGFVWMDGVISEYKKENGEPSYHNVSSFSFRAEQSAFLTGIAACVFLNINKEVFNGDGGLKVGGFVGLPLVSTLDFLAGFQAGVFAFNASLKNGANSSQMNSTDNGDETKANPNNSSNDWQKVEFIDLGSNISNWATGSFGVGDGMQISRTLVNKGADMIMAIAGPQTLDVISVAETSSRPVAVLGVDSAQEEQNINKPFTTLGDKKLKDAEGKEITNPKFIQFSAIKKLDSATKQVLGAIFNKKDPNNEKYNGTQFVKGFGFQNIGSIDNDTVGVSNAGLPYLYKFSKDWFKNGTTNEKNNQNEAIPENLKLNPEIVKKNNEYEKLQSDKSVKYLTKNSDDEKYYSSGWEKLPGATGEFIALPEQLSYPIGATHLDGSKWKLKLR
ncbi:BMP family lipoprotein [Malacoplasma iowae]|uniref:BMP family lipoprotein n=1 Tax=Malacoplasma iowae TaxID=2116 RepID=UPI002A18D9A2|nr:BMP family ABC transporter substrate-binding protein [Malacoplasma iowae]WPL39617.1 BMP family ABC transporter substrate-binding protein [Malacoplasma iowae]